MYIYDFQESSVDAVLSTLQVQVLVARRSRLGPEWATNDGLQSYGRLYFLKEGSCLVNHHGQEYQLRPGVLHVIPAHTPLRFRCPRHMVIDWAHFTANVLGGLDLFAFLQCGHELAPRRPQEIRRILGQLRQAMAGQQAENQLQAAGLMMQLLSLFVAGSDPDAQAERRQVLRFQPVLEYVDRHLSQPIRVADLARCAGLDSAYFTRLFCSQFGVSPGRYVLRKRIDQAQRLLWQGGAPLAEVAEQLGFSDAFHLSKAFKRLVGVPPQQFRARHGMRTVP